MIVLKYIADETRRFVTFLPNRVSIIQKESQPKQWPHVRSEHNPADYASRGIKAPAKETSNVEKWSRILMEERGRIAPAAYRGFRSTPRQRRRS